MNKPSQFKRATIRGSALVTFILLIFALLCCLTGPAHAATPKVTYYYTDPQGTVLAKADEQGNIISRSDRKPYGEQVMGTPEDGPGYTGHLDDPDSGLIYMQARYYDSVVGRFISVDPHVPVAGDLAKVNRFVYVNDNPAGMTDPDGREAACVSQPSHCRSMGEGIVEAPGAIADVAESVNENVITPIIAANPAAFEEASLALKGVSSAMRAISMARAAETAVESAEVPLATAEVASGEFSVIDWSGYPSEVPRPEGTLRVVSGEEYRAVRRAANSANQAIRRDQGLIGKAVDVHEVKPVKFGGSPTDPANKVILPRDIHQKVVTPWWNQFQKNIGA
ncbi:RHS repeat-associated core domain-containing protein [Luteibacter aegosomatis]|uniref:RHS repeat domain-containing protein n=1 Tax=Luteibacter aegosomatis TaxID=2911537 RepID=UPI001FFBEB13|nr:RHS repeat-associated core domain-containing protein [Luteibacter aegosomatis]UPG87751.1 RHS repeat-associated core domain-containing protein [Luteibacter aegosomatis]